MPAIGNLYGFSFNEGGVQPEIRGDLPEQFLINLHLLFQRRLWLLSSKVMLFAGSCQEEFYPNFTKQMTPSWRCLQGIVTCFLRRFGLTKQTTRPATYLQGSIICFVNFGLVGSKKKTRITPGRAMRILFESGCY
jgi:hypothetical protein